ncbi:hypothetical protein GGS23DRAFT_596472 [Durotheca rogersii]|uniref:uncharacterized protein n=1 Tax=Durotheca rogersii TaxID=419775 RepID=UPI00221EA2B0|nr:uncharacterized protein GGS23DRAFT_596472 [Durotheca rogersii]KAI5863991.1 hypothetical protein GGS23DRAFT_596472 [Durotheca rogersii]
MTTNPQITHLPPLSDIIREHPIGNGLDAFRSSFESRCRGLGISRAADALDHIDEKELQNLALGLLSALQLTPASHFLPSRLGGKPIFSDLLSLNSAILSNDFNLTRIKPLLRAALADDADDTLIWNHVHKAAAESTPPPQSIVSSFQTPWLHNTGSFANSSEYRRDIDRVLKLELGLLYPGGSSVEFEDVLFYICLPDLDNFKEYVHNEMWRLFRWLKSRNIGFIKSLDIPDSTTNPMCDALLEEAVFDKFEMGKLNWRKLDINLDILTRCQHAATLIEITLYSSGNWSLQKVTIAIVWLHPAYDEKLQQRHRSLSEAYAERLYKASENLPGYDFKVTIRRRMGFLDSLKLYDHLTHCHSFLEKLRNPDTEKNNTLEHVKNRFIELSSHTLSGTPDKRIKVAVIDHGADRIRSSVNSKIAKGISFVTGGAENGDRILPWWMAADPHGTQMASLISRANPFCRLYIARVGKGRRGIYQGTVTVAATDRYRHRRPMSASGVKVLVPGDNVLADGPLYMEKYASGAVSGSSVGIAFTAGIASMVLAFNVKNEKDFRDSYTQGGIMRVFDKI